MMWLRLGAATPTADNPVWQVAIVSVSEEPSTREPLPGWHYADFAMNDGTAAADVSVWMLELGATPGRAADCAVLVEHKLKELGYA